MSAIPRQAREQADACPTWGERALIDRLDRLRSILPALAQEAAMARREARQLRIENRRLARSLAEFECRRGPGAIGTSSEDGT
jgi:hypothetical protein